MLISVIIPHLNQEDYLKTGLDALQMQEGVKSAVEIIVVDNGSRRMPEHICSAYPNVSLVSEEVPGPGPARNKGVTFAKGDILAFIDADCRSHLRWLAAIERAFSDPAIQIIGGDVQVDYADPARPAFWEPYEVIYSYRNNEHIAEGFSGTGNLATRPEILRNVGPFARIEVAEDRDWGFRAGALGYTITYVPKMIVYHPARESFFELTHKWDRHIAHNFEDFATKPFGRLRWIGRIFAIAGSPVFEIPRVLRSDRISGVRERSLAFLCLNRIRLYRARRMLGLLLGGDGRASSGNWNRR